MLVPESVPETTVNDTDLQAGTIALLADPSTHGSDYVERIDTHISHLFLTDSRVYKLKRALKLPFVDYSTLALRHRACIAELEINRRTAPDLYLGVIPVTREASGELALNGGGQPVEWLVEMRRFPRGARFDELLAEGRLGDIEWRRLGDALAAFHLAAAPRRAAPGEGPVKTIDEMLVSLAGVSTEVIKPESAQRWAQLARASAIQRATLLRARERHGFVRHCHGDLHLANLCLINAQPTPFDAIEFNESLSNIDVAYDLAFTLMDLLHAGEVAGANAVLNRYLSRTRDYAAMGVLDLFLSLRAAIRAMVRGLAAADDEALAPEAAGYLALAVEHLQERPAPLVVAIGGVSGSGKSTLARGLAPDIAPAPGAVWISSDVVRKRMFGVLPEQELPDRAYTPAVAERVYRAMFKDGARALRAGQVVILDATFFSAEMRARCAAMATSRGAKFLPVWLQVEQATLRQRVANRVGDASDADEGVLAKQLKSFTPQVDWPEIAAGGPASALQEAVRDRIDAIP